MSSTNEDSLRFQRRLDVVQTILQKYGLKSTQVTPLAYVENSPFEFNNFIFKVDLAAPGVSAANFPEPQQPCTSAPPPPPAGVTTLVIHLSNPLAEGLNNTNRVENMVAAQFLVRQAALAGLSPVVPVPAVYAWSPCRYPEISDETGFGWTMSEYKLGSDLDAQFESLPLEEAQDVLEQIADLLTAVQRVELPDTVTKFGALTIDNSGNIVSGQMPILPGGPWETYEEIWLEKLQSQLAEADKSPRIRGWREVQGGLSGLRERIDKFLGSGRGVQKMLQGVVDTRQRGLVHGDLTMNNVLYDSTTKRVTGLLDFDWAAVTHRCEEFLSGLWDVVGGIHERVGELIQPMVLSGEFGVQPAGLSDAELRKWEIARAWNSALVKRGAIRPSSVAGVDRLKALKEFGNLLCPFQLASEAMLQRMGMSEENAAAFRASTETKIVSWLDRFESVES
ncbi:phosphotransferase enzyme family-domain-containing protein [Diplogelasinospora grovesii]|uniref:non-specific serine/threonine protein kinase n=1 Tax=Diplogelasinospora grovesii TaxID=303347 RepID=A0AAN6N465_9PEZI|nr:phosphotransferase enzyme family-domain-containing protein [Diplogelasinospora grovesii]